ncbi:hypothetical protein HOD61_01770 [archaeon]|jgi:nanoRNase/pAp phosphatase (c-di-AMP/oligoRNAs hydrolase)|nr:hypothetical protein [archaeon]
MNKGKRLVDFLNFRGNEPVQEPIIEEREEFFYDKEKSEILENKLSKVKGKMLIGMHDYPCGDAIASAYVWKEKILKDKFGIDSDIFYSGSVSHHENIALVKRLDSVYDFRMINFDEVDFSDYKNTLLLDVSVKDKHLTLPEKFKIDFVIDHHYDPSMEEIIKTYNFADVRASSDIGSTSTMTTEYLDAYGIGFDKENEKDQLLATALKLGILIDTNNLKKATTKEYLALAKLHSFVDRNTLEAILKPSRSAEMQNGIGRGLSQRKRVGIYNIGCAGYLSQNNRDTISVLAHELMAEEGIEAGIACAVIGDRIGISIKARESSKINAQKIAGLFGGGGRFDEAGASMPLGPFSDYKLDDKVLLDAIIDSLIIPKIENEM